MKPLRRSILSVPGHKDTMHAKAASCSADVIMLDLEDSCPPGEKENARRTVCTSARGLDWGDKTLTLRINDPSGPLCFRDVLDTLPELGACVRSLVIPKVETVSQIHYLDHLLSALEQEHGLETPIGLEPIIESARALRDADQIAAASPRIQTLVFGVADYSASINMPLSSISGHGESDGVYPGDPLHFVYSRLIMCAKAAGLQVIDAPYGNFRDPEGLQVAAVRSRALGFDGKWCIHPSQIDTVNAVFAPSEEEIDRARQVVAAHETAKGGAAAIGDSMVDAASVRMARDVLARAAQLD
jgi:citrate lyase beta subunit